MNLESEIRHLGLPPRKNLQLHFLKRRTMSLYKIDVIELYYFYNRKCQFLNLTEKTIARCQMIKIQSV